MDCNVEGMYISESVTIMNVGLQSQHREKKKKKRFEKKRDGPIDFIWQWHGM